MFVSMNIISTTIICFDINIIFVIFVLVSIVVVIVLIISFTNVYLFRFFIWFVTLSSDFTINLSSPKITFRQLLSPCETPQSELTHITSNKVIEYILILGNWWYYLVFSLAKSSAVIGSPLCRPEFVDDKQSTAFIDFEELRHPILCLNMNLKNWCEWYLVSIIDPPNRVGMRSFNLCENSLFKPFYKLIVAFRMEWPLLELYYINLHSSIDILRYSLWFSHGWLCIPPS